MPERKKKSVEQQMKEIIEADPELFSIEDTPEARQRAEAMGVRFEDDEEE